MTSPQAETRLDKLVEIAERRFFDHQDISRLDILDSLTDDLKKEYAELCHAHIEVEDCPWCLGCDCDPCDPTKPCQEDCPAFKK